MIWIVIAEGVVLVALALLVVALVHSYGGLAARVGLGDGTSRPRGAHDRGRAPIAAPARDGVADHIAGVSPRGEAVVLPVASVEHETLLAFLTGTCTSCAHLWHTYPEGPTTVIPRGVRLVVVTKGPSDESPSAILALAPEGADVIMSSDAWLEFQVPGSPYFVHLDGATGAVLGEGTALTWDRVTNLMGTAVGDERLTSTTRAAHGRAGGSREDEVDELLVAAGLHPGDPSLYPVPTQPSP